MTSSNPTRLPEAPPPNTSIHTALGKLSFQHINSEKQMLNLQHYACSMDRELSMELKDVSDVGKNQTREYQQGGGSGNTEAGCGEAMGRASG